MGIARIFLFYIVYLLIGTKFSKVEKNSHIVAYIELALINLGMNNFLFHINANLSQNDYDA